MDSDNQSGLLVLIRLLPGSDESSHHYLWGYYRILKIGFSLLRNKSDAPTSPDQRQNYLTFIWNTELYRDNIPNTTLIQNLKSYRGVLNNR